MLPLWNKLQYRKREKDNCTVADVSSKFKISYITFGNLVKKEQEWCITFIVSVTDCSPTDILRALTADKDAIAKILQTGTQMEMKQKLLVHHQIKDVLWCVLQSLHIRYGARLPPPTY